MSVNIQVTAETAQAARAMTTFTSQASAGLKLLDVTGKQAMVGIAEMTGTGTAAAASFNTIAQATATATNGINTFTAAAIRSALATNNITVLNGAVQDGAAKSAGSLKQSTKELNSAIKTVAISASAFAGPTASALLLPVLLFGKELKTLASGLKLWGLSLPVLATGIVGLGLILGAGSFYFSDYTKSVEKQTKAEETAIETNEKLASTILATARARRDAGAMSEESYNKILTSIKAANNQVTLEGTTRSLLGLSGRLRNDPEFTPPISRETFEKSRDKFGTADAYRFARSAQVMAADPGNSSNDALRLIDIATTLTSIEKRRAESAAARETKIISEQEYLRLETTDLTTIAALESNRLDIVTRRISANFKLTEAEKFDQLRGAGVPKDQLGADPRSFADQISVQFVQLQNQMGTFSQASAALIAGGVGTAIQGVSDGIMGLIDGTRTWAQTWGSVLKSMAAQGIQFIVQQTAAFLLAKGKELLIHMTTESAKTAGTVTNAATRTTAVAGEASMEAVATGAKAAGSVASIPYVGWALAIAAFAGVIAMVAAAASNARAAGGPVAAGQPHLVGELGPEIFVPSERGFVMNNRDSMKALKGGTKTSSGGADGGVNIKTIIVANIQQAMEEAMASQTGTKIIIQTVDGRRLDAGFDT